jgi:hypothetical protein
MPDPANSVTVNPDAVYRPLDEGGVVLDVATGAYFELNSAGRVLWERLSAGDSFESIVVAMTAEFGIDRATADRDLAEFIQALRDRSLIQD